ncbi:MAG: tol-pal system protein YbgF [Gammaproteobacteria bacterium]|nr:tol-pal system protein YbgF [Gammaproteobacteria bacterium]
MSVCLGGVVVPGASSARDVQLRSQSDADATGTSFPATSTSIAPGSSAGGAQRLSTEERLTRLEGTVDGQMLDVILRLQAIEREIQMLRGNGEMYAHQIQEQTKNQRDLYLDLDQRLTALEKQLRVLTASPTVTAATTSPAVVASTAVKPATENPAAVIAAPDDQQAYQEALDRLYQQQYDKAIAAFRAYIQKYPKGRYAHVSQYWIAEAFFTVAQYKPAVIEYQKLIDEYPSSPKLAEAMLKMGEGYLRLNETPQAKKSLEQVVHTYPGTDEAKQAQVLLQKLVSKPAAPTANKKKPN